MNINIKVYLHAKGTKFYSVEVSKLIQTSRKILTGQLLFRVRMDTANSK
ncbi:hypothetical protein ACIROD_15895 [Peribacillus sp. NPDC101481]